MDEHRRKMKEEIKEEAEKEEEEKVEDRSNKKRRKRRRMRIISRRESRGGMEWLGVWNCIFSGSEISNFGACNLSKIALSAKIQAFSCKFRPLKNIFRTLGNGHSIRHQSMPPLPLGTKTLPN